jgi:hypothetical protein
LLRWLALAAVAALASAPLASSGPRAGSGAAHAGGLRAPFYSWFFGKLPAKTGDVPEGASITDGSSERCPAGWMLLSGGVILAQEKYTGSIVSSYPESDYWKATVVNPGLGLGEPGQLELTGTCVRLDHRKLPSDAHGPVTGVSVITEEKSGHIAEQETLSGHVLCNPKPSKQISVVGGGFALTGTSSAAPIESHLLILRNHDAGWVAGADNRGIGETPGTLTVYANCLRFLHERGQPALDSLFTRVVGPETYALSSDDAAQHGATCPEHEGETSWAVSGGFDLGYDPEADLPHVYESAPSDDGKSWLVGAVNPPLSPQVDLYVYAVCLVEVR